jgi:predicted transcriptional regulator of viral defense system
MLALFDQLHQLNYFSTKQVIALGLDPNHAHVWLHREVAKGTIYRISNGFYVTHEKKQQLIYTKMRGHWTYYLACQVLYPGAVISHETVLGQHQIIPEMLT